MIYPEDESLPGPGHEEYVDHARAAAAELLRGFTPAHQATPLSGCLERALAATEGDPERRARVVAAGELLGLGGQV